MIIKKKKFFTREKILLLTALVFGLLALCMIFADCTYLVGESEHEGFSSEKVFLSGIEATFGKEGVVNFSVPNLICYILTLACIVLTLIKFCGKLKSRKLTYALFAMFLICSIMFYSSGALMVLAKDSNSKLAEALGVTISKNLAYGAIISGFLCLFSSLIMFYLASVQRTRKTRK